MNRVYIQDLKVQSRDIIILDFPNCHAFLRSNVDDMKQSDSSQLGNCLGFLTYKLLSTNEIVFSLQTTGAGNAKIFNY